MSFDREMPRALAKVPLVVKILIGVVPILIAVLYSYYSTRSNIKNKRRFYEIAISSVIIKSNISEGRTTEFHTANGLKIYFSLSAHNTLSVGDSIEKESNTYIYDVYRKDANEEYKFWATYNFEKVY